MKISDVGINLITLFEGIRLKAYKPVSTEKYYTIGYGHYGADVTADMQITKEQAIDLLKKDIEKFEAKVNKYEGVYHFNQNQFDALVSFAFNVGNIDQLTAKGTRSIEEISKHMPMYNKAGGKVLNGLTRRRNEEQKLFNTPTDTLVYVEQNYSEYFAKCSIPTTSLVDALKHIGVDSSFSTRKKIAVANGITNYAGLGSQNVALLNLLKEGKLKKFS